MQLQCKFYGALEDSWDSQILQELKLDSKQTSSCQKAPKTGAKVCLSVPSVGEMFIMCQTKFWLVQSTVGCRS